MLVIRIACVIFLLLTSYSLLAQNIPVGYVPLEETLRRLQLSGQLSPSNTFSVRPSQIKLLDGSAFTWDDWEDFSLVTSDSVNERTHKIDNFEFYTLPLRSITRFTSGRPQGHTIGMISPSVGWQNLVSFGFEANYKFIHLSFQPEFYTGQNLNYEGFLPGFSTIVNTRRVGMWVTGDIQELQWIGSQSLWNWGNSKFSLRLGAFETGISTENIWWGPGQFHALVFSHAAQGFPHITFNTTRPAKTFLGSFEGQLLVGKLQSRFNELSQNSSLNQISDPFPNDARFLNALNLTYTPKWIGNVTFGVTRTFQQYGGPLGNGILDWFPVFEPLQKIRFLGDSGFSNDEIEQDQQLSVFSRVLIPKAQAELYVEFGKRDHNLNWREAILNPEHARAYKVGFSKLINTTNKLVKYQVRGEMVQTSNSISHLTRDLGVSTLAWHMHSRVLGFKNFGQFLGLNMSGIGNSQILEISRVNGIKKIGFVFERFENNQDLFKAVFQNNPANRPWVDFSLGAVVTHNFGPLLVDLTIKSIHAYNYQWAWNHPNSSNPFGSVPRRTDFLMQWHFYYIIPDGLLKK